MKSGFADDFRVANVCGDLLRPGGMINWIEANRWAEYALSGLRIMVGLTFFQHGTHKYFNFPPGQSFAGINLATMQGWAGTIELFAGALILIGLFTRFAAFVAAGEMAVGYFMVHAPQGIFTAKNGGEPAYLFCFVFLFFVFAGPGPISIDHGLRRHRDAKSGTRAP